jgi:SAM-dependent methyltransferase
MCPETRKSPARVLKERRQIWESKEIIRRLYSKWYRFIKEALRSGITLELGGGSGNLKEFLPEAITSDMVFAPWLDAVMDAHTLPFKEESLDNVVLFDVLHHLATPSAFFHEMERVLRPRGRLVMMEPYVSWLSFPVYRFLHPEGMRWNRDPFHEQSLEGKNPFEGNQAIPTLIFEKHRTEFFKEFLQLRLVIEERMDFFLYPLSGGFHHRSLCPEWLWKGLESVEHFCRPLKSFIAFRMFIVIEKSA